MKPQRIKRDRSEEFASFVVQPRQARMATAADLQRATIQATALVKIENRRQQNLRDSARDEQCLVRLPGCTTHAIWSHNRHGRAGKGRGIKSLDLNGCYCCPSCDAIYDGQKPLPAGTTREEVELSWYHAHAESLVKARQKGLV